MNAGIVWSTSVQSDSGGSIIYRNNGESFIVGIHTIPDCTYDDASFMIDGCEGVSATMASGFSS